jgi:hypothetical protein
MDATWENLDECLRLTLGYTKPQWDANHRKALPPTLGGIAWRRLESLYSEGRASLNRALARYDLPTDVRERADACWRLREAIDELAHQRAGTVKHPQPRPSAKGVWRPKPSRERLDEAEATAPFGGLTAFLTDATSRIRPEPFQRAVQLHLRGGPLPKKGPLIEVERQRSLLCLPPRLHNGDNATANPTVARDALRREVKSRGLWARRAFSFAFAADVGRLVWQEE